MPSCSCPGFLRRWRFRLFVWLLQIPVLTVCAAEKKLATDAPPSWVARGNATPLGRLSATNRLRLSLALPLRHAAQLTNFLAGLYRPGSPQFHRFLTPRQFTDRFGPTPEDYAAVQQFAATNGWTVIATRPDRLLLEVEGGVSDIERALQLKLYSFRHPTEPRNFFAPDREPTVDARLPLLQVSGLNDYSRPRPNVLFAPQAPVSHRPARDRPAPGPRTSRSANDQVPNGGSSPFGTFMGNDFRQAYIPGTPLTGTGQNVALLQFDDFHPEDITNYADAIGLTNWPQISVVPVDGGVAYPGGGSVEVALDIEMVLAMAPGISNIYVYEAPDQTPWEDILSQMADDDLAAQLSCSWSGGGPDAAAEQVFQQMAAQGQSFFNATGDTGAFGTLVPFPSGSPNVTQVGGTYLDTDTNGDYVDEVAWNRGNGVASSGGVAPGSPFPPWQLGLDMNTNGGSTVCRNLPDVALTADEIYVIADGQQGLAGGTSCAAPLWAALTALINQQAAQLGRPAVGFLNPALYALCRGTNYDALFHDIIDGNNSTSFSPTNYDATPGFDLCTGWGTPASTNLINALTTPDFLGLMPPASLSLSCFFCRQFSPPTWSITLTNSGAADLDWAFGALPPWLSLSAANGTLPATSTTNLTLQLAGLNPLPGDVYSATLAVTNLQLSTVQDLSVQVSVSPSIAQNGGFETGDFTGWTLAGDTVVGTMTYNAVATEAQFPGVVHSGFFGALLGQNGYAATLSQTLPTLPGQQYLVSCWLNNPNPASGQSFDADWDGTNFIDLVAPPAFDWTNIQFVVTAAGTNDTLEFAAEDDSGYFGLDDVSVTPIPAADFFAFGYSTNGFQLAWPSLAGLNYLVQYSSNLFDGTWQDLGAVTAWTNWTTLADTNLDAACPQRFYRLIRSP